MSKSMVRAMPLVVGDSYLKKYISIIAMPLAKSDQLTYFINLAVYDRLPAVVDCQVHRSTYSCLKVIGDSCLKKYISLTSMPLAGDSWLPYLAASRSFAKSDKLTYVMSLVVYNRLPAVVTGAPIPVSTSRRRRQLSKKLYQFHSYAPRRRGQLAVISRSYAKSDKLTYVMSLAVYNSLSSQKYIVSIKCNNLKR